MIKNKNFRASIEDYHKTLKKHNNEYIVARKKLQNYASTCEGNSIQCVHDYDALYNSLKNISEKQYQDLKEIIEEHEHMKNEHRELSQSIEIENNDLSGKMEDLESQNEFITKMNKKYSTVVKLKNSQIKDLRKENKQLRTDLKKQEFEHSTLKVNYPDVNEKLKNYEEKVEQHKKTIAQLRQSHAANYKKMKNLESQQDAAIWENKRYSNFAMRKATEIKNHKKEIAQLKTNLNEKESHHSILKDQFQNISQNNAQNLREHKEEIEALRDSHESIFKTMQALESHKKGLIEKINKHKDFSKLKTLEIQKHKNENAQLRSSLDEKEFEHQILFEEFQNTNEKLMTSKQNLQKHKDEIEVLRQSHVHISDTDETNTELKQKLSQMEFRYRTLELNKKEMENIFSSEIAALRIVNLSLSGLGFNNNVLGEQMNNNKILQNGGKNPVEEAEIDDVFANIATSKSFQFAFDSLREDKEILEVQLQNLKEEHRIALQKYESLASDMKSKEAKIEYESKVNEIVTILDKNRSGTIDFHEFEALYPENTSQIFHQLDIDGSLDLSIDELKALISSNKIADEILNQLKEMEKNRNKDATKSNEIIESKQIENLKKEVQFQKNRMKTYVRYVNERGEESNDLKIEMGKKIADFVKNKKEQSKRYQITIEKLQTEILNLQKNDDSNELVMNKKSKKIIDKLQAEIKELQNLIQEVCQYYYSSHMY